MSGVAGAASKNAPPKKYRLLPSQCFTPLLFETGIFRRSARSHQRRKCSKPNTVAAFTNGRGFASSRAGENFQLRTRVRAKSVAHPFQANHLKILQLNRLDGQQEGSGDLEN